MVESEKMIEGEPIQKLPKPEINPEAEDMLERQFEEDQERLDNNDDWEDLSTYLDQYND